MNTLMPLCVVLTSESPWESVILFPLLYSESPWESVTIFPFPCSQACLFSPDCQGFKVCNCSYLSIQKVYPKQHTFPFTRRRHVKTQCCAIQTHESVGHTANNSFGLPRTERCSTRLDFDIRVLSQQPSNWVTLSGSLREDCVWHRCHQLWFQSVYQKCLSVITKQMQKAMKHQMGEWA